MIQVEHLTKRFGPVTAVDDLSFEVARGDVLGFLGPNGAGKTTTMRILTGFLPPTEGRVSVAGHDVFQAPLEVKRRVGYLPESVPVYPEMTVADYLRFVAELKRIPSRERRSTIERSMALADIADRRSRIIGHLSKGYRKRVGLAQALLGNPEVLVLDEPTEGLDPNQVVSIRQLVTSLSGERTVIVSTHILSEVEQTCTRVLIIDRGKLVASDSVEHLRASARQGGVRLTVAVRGTGEVVREAVVSLPGVRGVEVSAETDGVATLSLTLDEPETSARVAEAIVGARHDLLEMVRERASLEEVFIGLTRRGGARTEGDGR